MSTTAPAPTFDADAYARAAEHRDAATMLSMYADDAEMVMVDHVAQPSHPRIMHGMAEIKPLMEDIYGREMTHSIDQVVMTDEGAAMLESCTYPTGEKVTVASLMELRDGHIVRHTSVQAWDEA